MTSKDSFFFSLTFPLYPPIATTPAPRSLGAVSSFPTDSKAKVNFVA
jgi:hypothetical protein